MKAKIIIKNILLSFLFLTLFCMLLSLVTRIFREKGDNWGTQDTFAMHPPNSVDLVFIGTSHQFCSVNPDLLYEEYGISSHMLATPAQTVPMSYYAAMEAIELQHPKAIAFEVLYCINDFRTLLPEMSHSFFDGMPDCRAKHEGIKDLIEEEPPIYYYLNFGLYHSRWKNLEEKDFTLLPDSRRGTFFSDHIESNMAIPVIPKSEKKEMPEEMFRYLEMLVELCRENDVKLIMYVVPYNALYDDPSCWTELSENQKVFNWIGSYAEEKGIPWHNLFYELDEIGFDLEKDFMGTQHLNCYGQEKLTRYLAEKGYLDF